MMMLYDAYLAFFTPLSPGVITIILCSSLTDNCNKHFRTNYGPACTFIENLDSRQLLETAKPEDGLESICKDIF